MVGPVYDVEIAPGEKVLLPEVTLISVGHPPELEEFHLRKLVFQYQPDGARLVGDEALPQTFRRSTRLLSRLFTRAERPRGRGASHSPHRAAGTPRRECGRPATHAP